jgi:hypothetical protein
MKKLACWGIIVPLLIIACTDEKIRGVEGMWQLKTITENGIVSPVDTVFYSFQLKQEGFTYTILQESSNTPEQTSVFFGYVDFPSQNQMHIVLDQIHSDGWAETVILWHDREVTYDILKLTSKEMILKQKDREALYSFIKF